MVTNKTGLEGWFNIQVIRNDIIIQETEFKNTITNNGLNMFGTMNPINDCAVGTGILTGSLIGATGLNAFAFKVVGGSTPQNTVSRTSSAPFYSENVFYWRIDNISSNYILKEVAVGVGYDVTDFKVFSLSTIKDNGGNPTSLSVLLGDSLQVTYKFRLYANTTPITGTIAANLNMPTQSFSVVPNFTLWDINNFPIGYQLVECYTSTSTFNPDITVAPYWEGLADSVSWAAYSDGNYYRDVTYSMGVNSSNIGNIVQIFTGGVPIPIKIGLTPGFTKTSDYTASITIRYSWARHV